MSSHRPALANPPVVELSPASSSRPRTLGAGDVLDRKYRLESVIAEGGMGVIWLATQLDLGRPVAIKVVREEYARDQDVVIRTLDEARAIAQLKGEHAVRVLEIARLASGSPFIVMEHLEGNDLASELARRGPLPLCDAVEYLLQACEGLAEAHALGLVHRDLKPENLFLAVQPDGSLLLKILDFGVAKRVRPAGFRRVTLRGTTVGSPQYMAPEQMHSLPDVDQRADVWSLGAILYELLTGIRTFDGANLQDIQHFVLELEPAPPSSFDPELPDLLDRIVQRCLEKDRDRRYPSVEALAADLALLGGERASWRAERTSRVASGVRRSRIELVAEADEAPSPAPTRAARGGRPARAIASVLMAALLGGAAVPLYDLGAELWPGARLQRAAFHTVRRSLHAIRELGAAPLVVSISAGEPVAPLVVPVPAPGSERVAD